MNFKEIQKKFEELSKFGIHPGLSATKKILKRLGNPQEKIKCIHVAGTNGKGSVSTEISNVLIDAGFKTGLFTSPYIVSPLEKIRLNGLNILENEWCKAFDTVYFAIMNERECDQSFSLTQFEIETCMAFLYFFEKECDYIVLEVGLGGRLDSTNVIETAEVCVITSISFDHTEILGNTLKEIANEKFGIVKENSKVVVNNKLPKEAFEVGKKNVKKQNAQLFVCDLANIKILNKNLYGSKFEYPLKDGAKLKVGLKLGGQHQIENAVLSIKACELLGIPYCAIKSGLERTVMNGRMEQVDESPIVILDGGHNPACAEALSEFIKNSFIGKNIVFVIAMMNDKDKESYIKLIIENSFAVICCDLKYERAEKGKALLKFVSKYQDKSYYESNPKQALKKAKKIAGEDGVVVVCGSFYLLGEILDK